MGDFTVNVRQKPMDFNRWQLGLINNLYSRTVRALAENFHHSGSDLMELCPCVRVRVANGNRHASVTSIANVWFEWYTPDEGNPQTVAFLLSPSAPENHRLLPTIRAREKAHVFNDPKEGSPHLFEHLRALLDVQ